MRLLLHHDGSGRDPITMADIAQAKLDQVARPKPAVDSEIEQGELALSSSELQPHTNGANFFELEGREPTRSGHG